MRARIWLNLDGRRLPITRPELLDGTQGIRKLHSWQASAGEGDLLFGKTAIASHARIPRPRGWRAPSFAFSKYSLRYLLEAGFEYDSSLMGDDIPYALRDGNASLLEFPVDWTLDDFPHYAHNRDLGYSMPISSPQRAMEVFRSEFDAAWEFGALWISV